LAQARMISGFLPKSGLLENPDAVALFVVISAK
jgi:hypothetical protein